MTRSTVVRGPADTSGRAGGRGRRREIRRRGWAASAAAVALASGILAFSPACVKKKEYSPAAGDYRWVPFPPDESYVWFGDPGRPSYWPTRFPALFIFSIHPDERPRTAPDVHLVLPPGSYLVRVESDPPATLNVLTSGGEFPVSGGFDLPSPVCVHVCVPPAGCSDDVTEYERHYLEFRILPVGPAPHTVAMTVENTEARLPRGPARWTCPEVESERTDASR